MEMSRAMEAVSQYTADQWGLVTAAQAKQAGVGAMTLSRLVEAGLLDRVRHGCYLATSAPAQAHVRERATWLLLNPAVPAWERQRLDADGGVLSHGSATLLHGLGDLLGETVEVTVPRRRASRQPDVRMRVAVLAEDEVTLVDGLPVTTVARTILDLLGDHLDGGHIGQVIYDAVVAGHVDAERLAADMGGFARRYGIARKDGRALLEDLLAQAGHTPQDLNRPRLPQRALSHPLSARDLLPPDLLVALSKAVRTPTLSTNAVAAALGDMAAVADAIRPGAAQISAIRSALTAMPTALDLARLDTAQISTIGSVLARTFGGLDGLAAADADGTGEQPPGRLPDLSGLIVDGPGSMSSAGEGSPVDAVADDDKAGGSDDNAVS